MSEIGFDVQSVEKTGGFIETQTMLMTQYILHLLVPRGGRLGTLLVTGLILAPIGMIGSAFAWLLPADKRLFIDLVILARKPLNAHAPKREVAEQVDVAG